MQVKWNNPSISSYSQLRNKAPSWYISI